MARLIRSKDWSQTPLGPMSDWPQSLRTTVSLCLASNFPINIVWGDEHTQIYNDGYRVVCGEAHPVALGQDYTVTWASAWPAIGEPFERALAGETSFLENQRMFLTRNGYLEETFFTFSLSPILDESGGIGGVFHPVTETTPTMLAERRTRALRELTATLGTAADPGALAGLTVETLLGFEFDLPFVLFYELEPGGTEYHLTGHHGIVPHMPGSPARIDADAISPWPIANVVQTGDIQAVEDIAALLSGSLSGPYDEAPGRALLLPIQVPGMARPPAIMITGASPRLPFDDAYRGFFELLTATIAAALATMRAREDERRRTEALSAIDAAKTAFFSNVSHEFRTPLTLMLGPIEDALGDAEHLPEQQRERLIIAHRNAQRLLKLVNALLDFSRSEAGRSQARFEPTDLAGLTVDLASNFRSACEQAGLALLIDCPPLAQPVYVDRDMWEKIVLNLLSNAFKFTLEGRIEVSLRPGGDTVELAVTDSGVGIPAAELPRVFERFHRIEGQRGRSYEGTGIGLSLVHELATLHGGILTVESVEGEGTTFRLTLPFGSSHLSRDELGSRTALASTDGRAIAFVEEALRWLPDRAEAKPGAASVSLTFADRPRVVLADDNADMRAYVRRILEEGGYQVQSVEDGAAALDAVREGSVPDLVISDVMMPGMDGFQLLAALRSDPDLEGLLVILLSARAGEEARVEGLAAGADDYLVKPFSARELRARADGAIRLARQRREASAREAELSTALATERSRAALVQTEQQLDFALTSSRLGSWKVELPAMRWTASQICRATFGFAPSEPFDNEKMLARVHPDDAAERSRGIAEAIERHSDLDLEYRVVRPDGSVSWVQVRGRADYNANGIPVCLAGISLDITERKTAELRQRLLLDELNHRVKNTLATVQAIAMQTHRHADDPAALVEAMEARINALAGAHDLLTERSWQGAGLADVVRRTLEPFEGSGAGNRILVEGPAIQLSPNAAVTLSMAFHELATNAAKYGACRIRAAGSSCYGGSNRPAKRPTPSPYAGPNMAGRTSRHRRAGVSVPNCSSGAWRAS